MKQDWNQSLLDINTLKDSIEQKTEENISQLNQRSWLLNWSLFIAFNHPKGKEFLLELFFNEK